MSSLSDKQNSGSHNRFVIKLCIAGADVSPQIRRVKLSRITVNGEISYPALVDIAIRYTFPDTPDVGSENYSVLLTYLDVDNDCITIASTEELIDAIEQFNKPGSDSLCLRITTEVKLKNEPSPRKKPSNIFKGSKDLDEDDSQRGHIVESFVSILTDAVDKLQTRVAENISSNEPGNSSEKLREEKEKNRKEYLESQRKRAKKWEEKKKREDEARVRAKLWKEKNQQELNAKVGSTQNSVKESREEAKQARSDHRRNETKKVVNEKRQQEVKQTGNEKQPFIHPRHTCDGCLVTPIIGLRYHSTNLPDYDLCEKCRNNYKGDQIKFEVVELECDRSVQERYRKRRKREERGASCHNVNRRAMPFWKNRKDTDPDLTEAIRRSLRDVPSDTQDDSLKKKKKVPKDNIVHEESNKVPILAVEDNIENGVESNQPLSDAIKDGVVVNENSKTPLCKNTGSSSNKKSSVQSFAPEKSASYYTALLQKSENKKSSEQSIVPEKSASYYTALLQKAESKKSSEQSTVPEKSASDYIGMPEKSASDNSAAIQKSESSVDDMPRPDSSSSATDNSDEDLQESPINNEESNPRVGTDRTADKLNSETDLVSEVSLPMVTSVAQVAAQPCPSSSEKEKVASPEKSTSLVAATKDDNNKDDHKALSERMAILGDGVTNEQLDQEKNDGESTSTDSQDSWQVIPDKEIVTEEQVVTEEQTESDEMIARGVQMLGSALFESDLLNSENVSSMTNSESLSVPSSVPTTLLLTEECEISPTVIDKWDNHLFQLHELGFQDDKKSIEILERLAAANIGVDSEDEVSVTQVVNELLKY